MKHVLLLAEVNVGLLYPNLGIFGITVIPKGEIAYVFSGNIVFTKGSLVTVAAGYITT